MNIPVVLNLLWLLRQLRQRERWTCQQIHAYQTRSLRRLRDYAYAHSPFYRKFHQGLSDRSLRELPILTKTMMMEHFDELVTDRAIRLMEVEAYIASSRCDSLYLDRYWVSVTSGSTGRRGIFLYNRAGWATVLASFARSREWAGIGVSSTPRLKTAIIASTSPWHLSSLVSATSQSAWMPTLHLAASEPLEVNLQRLNEWQPDMLVSYASMARILADEQLTGRLHIAPQVIFTISEVLTDETRRDIEQAWGKPPFDQYGATEAGGIAAECEHHCGMHLYEDLVITEVVDKDHRPVPPGLYGDKLLITVLSNYTQPLIRYELSDSVRLASEPCLCGRPFARVAAIQGRTEDILYFPTATGGEVAVHPYAFECVMDTVPASGWQVLQEDGGLRVLLSDVPDGFVDDVLVASLRHVLAAQGAVVPRIKVQRVTTIPKTAAGKTPLVKSNVRRSRTG